MNKIRKKLELYRIMNEMRREEKSLLDMERNLQGFLPDDYVLSLEAWVDRGDIYEAQCKIFFRKNKE